MTTTRRPTIGAFRMALATVIAVAFGALLGGCSRIPTPEPLPGPPAIPATALEPTLIESLQRTRQVVSEHPSSGDAWGRLGQAFHAGEYAEEARTCYRRAAVLEPAVPRWPHLLGLLQLHDRFEEAATNLALAVSLSGGTNDAPQLRLAQALVEHGQFDDATRHLNALLQARPDHPAARLELARIHVARGVVSNTASLLSPCLTNPFTARPAALLLSQVLAREGRTEAAAALATRAAVMPKPFDWPDPFLREVQALRTDRRQVAEKANALAGQRRFAEAEALLTELLRQDPEDSEGLLLSGRVLLQQRKCAEAEERLRAHLRVTPDSLNGLIQLALSLLCQQRWADASNALGRVIALKPDFAQAHANLAIARSRLGDIAGAIRSYEDALRCSPGDAGNHAALAEELLRGGRREEALAHVARALALDPTQPRAKALQERLGGSR